MQAVGVVRAKVSRIASVLITHSVVDVTRCGAHTYWKLVLRPSRYKHRTNGSQQTMTQEECHAIVRNRFRFADPSPSRFHNPMANLIDPMQANSVKIIGVGGQSQCPVSIFPSKVMVVYDPSCLDDLGWNIISHSSSRSGCTCVAIHSSIRTCPDVSDEALACRDL